MGAGTEVPAPNRGEAAAGARAGALTFDRSAGYDSPVLLPGLKEGMPAPAWCRDHEFACTLEDYLRRRTNVAQWIPRGGLGRRDEHLERLRALAVEITGGDVGLAEGQLDRYRSRVAEEFDQVLARV